MTSVSQKPAPRALLPAPGRRKLWTNLTPAATSGLSTAEGAPSHRVPTTPPPGRSGLAINQSVMRSRCFTSSTRPRWTCFAGLSRKPIVKGFSSAMRILAVPICPKAFRPGSRFSSRPCRAGCLSIRPMPETGAILHHALHALYLEERGRWCISRPTQTMAPLFREPFVAEQAFKGMYRVAAAADSPLQVRLCGAGRALARVQQAAKVLKNWGLRLKSGVAPATRGWRRTPNSPTCSRGQRRRMPSENVLGTGNAPSSPLPTTRT